MEYSLLSLFSKEHPKVTILDYLQYSPFDEMIEINLRDDHYRFVYNIDEKYHVETTEGSFRTFVEEVVRNELLHPDDVQIYTEAMNPDTLAARLQTAELPGVLRFEFRSRDFDSGWRWVNQILVGRPVEGIPADTVYVYVFDVQNIKDREAGLTLVSNERQKRNKLTGLRGGNDFFSGVTAKLRQQPEGWMLLVIDLEEFKLFNEWYGRDTGDKVLARIGGGLHREEKEIGGVAGYMGNDDFCMLVPEENYDVQHLFDRIHRVVVQYSQSVAFLPAIGIARSESVTTGLQLYDQASFACQLAKHDFRERIIFFDPAMYRETADDYRMLSAFQEALKNREITFYLQPQCRARNGRIVGAEALVRWIKPDGTIVSPPEFVPVLEKYGFIPDMDTYIWEKVCRWLRECADRGLTQIPVSVNISPVDIFTIDVPAYLEELVTRYGLPKSVLKAEITESAYSGDAGKVTDTVRRLRESGFVVLMDDFGSGYSSLNMLHELTVDIIKLDANFLHLDSRTETKGMHILESVVNMAKTMGLPIIVEGVETEGQKDYLMDLGCRYIQGYYFYKPMPVENFESLISRRGNVEEGGFRFIHNEQFHIREFLNDTVVSDSMLNNVIGPAAIYALRGDEVDIVRYNHQFYHAVNVPDFVERVTGIQRFMPPGELPMLRQTMEKAYQDRLNGASGVFTFFRIDGGASSFLIHFYFLSENDTSLRFYGAARDVTEIATLNRHMELLARYTSHCVIFLIWMHGQYTYEVGANGLERDMGLSKETLEAELNSGAFFERVADFEALRLRAGQAIAAQETFVSPLSIRSAKGEMLSLVLKIDPVLDDASDVRSILSIRKMED